MDPNDAPAAARPSALVTPVVHQRVGDLERSAICEELAAQFAAGRLNGDELEERLAAAVGAQTRWDLRLLVRDLPRAAERRPPEPSPPSAPAARWTAADGLILCVAVLSGFIGLVMMAMAVAVGAFDYLTVAAAGSALAATLAASGTHLIHRSWNRHVAVCRGEALGSPAAHRLP